MGKVNEIKKMDDDHFSRRSSVLKGDLPEDFASMETERILMYQREDTEDYGNIDTDRTVQGFKASLRVLLADERLRHSGGWEAEIIDKCSSALNNFVELHYDKRHLHDVLRRQKEEIEKLKNQDRNTEKVNMALYKVNEYYDNKIDDLDKKNSTEANQNIYKEKKIDGLKSTKQNTIDQTKTSEDNHKVNLKNLEKKKDEEIQAKKKEISNMGDEKKKLIAEFEETKKLTAGMKAAIENARIKLEDAIEIDTIDEVPQTPKSAAPK